MIWEAVVILVLICINGLFSMAEIALISAKQTRLRQLADGGDARAAVALELALAPNSFLSTVQIGITLVGILAGAFGGATLGENLGAALARIPAISGAAPEIGFGLVVVAVTYLSLVIGELVPKQLALAKPERMALAVARPIRFLVRISTPLERFLTRSTQFVLRLIGMRHPPDSPLTEADIKGLIQQGGRTGVIQPAEQDMLEGVFDLGDRNVPWLMTPRPEVTWLDVTDSAEETHRKMTEAAHSRFPVVSGDLDNLLGIVHVRDLLLRALSGQAFDLRASLRPPFVVPETMPVSRVLEGLRAEGRHFAVVVDEHGGIQGVVTLTDILEAIVGDLPAPGARPDPLVTRREDGSWLVDGLLPAEDLKALLGWDRFPDEPITFLTAGGFVMSQSEHLPTAGQHFEVASFRFEVVDMDGRRVDKVLVSPLRKEAKPVA